MAETKRPVSKRLKKEPSFFSPDGQKVTNCYCRKCMQVKKANEFYGTTDAYLDTNGKMSICNSCIDDIYKKIYSVEKDIPKTLLKVCRIINSAYIPRTVEAVVTWAAEQLRKGSTLEEIKPFAYYKAKMGIGIPRDGLQPEDMTFKEIPFSDIPEDLTQDEEFVDEDVKRFWGGGFSYDDYKFLENQYSQWEATHSINTQSEKTLLRMICIKLLDIEKDRLSGGNTATKIKEFQELLKTSALTPALSNVANSGKSVDTFGAFIKIIEESEPCEYYKDKSLFKDFDNIESYIKKYITRPIRNFIVGSRDYNISEEEVSSEEDEYEFPDDLNDGEKNADES